jgi:hypothetical protein
MDRGLNGIFTATVVEKGAACSCCGRGTKPPMVLFTIGISRAHAERFRNPERDVVAFPHRGALGAGACSAKQVRSLRAGCVGGLRCHNGWSAASKALVHPRSPLPYTTQPVNASVFMMAALDNDRN